MENCVRKNRDNIAFLRVMACLGVFIVHIGQAMELQGSIRVVTDFGQYGVHLFFIISGFLAYSSYSACESKWSYWWKRAIKILPLYYSVILYYYVLHTFILKDVPKDIYRIGWSRYTLFLSGIVRADDGFWNNLGFTWSIPIFVLFYILVPCLYKVVNSYGRAWMGIFVFFFVNQILSVYGNGNLRIFTYMLYFMIGVVAYFAVKLQKDKETISVWAIISLLLILQSATCDLVYVSLFAVIFLATMDMKIKSMALKNIVKILDKYSYTVYLIQGIVYHSIANTTQCSKEILMLIIVIATIVLTLVSYHCIEMPLQKIFTKMKNRLCESKTIKDVF